MKNIIIYYSKVDEQWFSSNLRYISVGNTEKFAQKIAKYIDADIFVIEPSVPYPKGYNETCDIAQKEKENNLRPKIKNRLENIESYDHLFIGFPIWYGDYPMIIQTFIESYNLIGKTIIPFCTNEGSGLCKTDEHLQQQLPNSIVLKGLDLIGSNVDNEDETIKNWLKEIGLI